MSSQKPARQRNGYVRCEVLHPIRGFQILSKPDMPAKRVLAVLTEDGPLALGVDHESARSIGEALMRAVDEIAKERN